jgi:hypothetical protein
MKGGPEDGASAPLDSLRHVAGRDAFEAVRAYPAGLAEAPLKAGLLGWIHALTQARVAFETDVSWAREATAPRARVVLEATHETSYREAWSAAIGARDAATRSAWLDAAAGVAPALAPIAREAHARRDEVAKRLGFGSFHEARGGALPPRLHEAARRFLSATSELRAWLRRSSGEAADAAPAARLSGWIGQALATDAREGWPARLSLRWLDETLPELTRGVVERPSVPGVTGAASFARALFALGRAAREGGRTALPFSVARAPFWADPCAFGFVVGALPTQLVFHRVSLGLGHRIASSQARSLARTALLEAAFVAARWRLSEGGGRDAHDWEEVTHDVFGGPIDARFAGAWPAPQDDDGPRLEALFSYPALAGSLVSRFDVDWFRNPRAGEWIRARAAGPALLPPDPAEAEPVVDGASALARLFEEALG